MTQNDQNIICMEINTNDKNVWCVFEKATEQVIKAFREKRGAVNYKNFIDRGGAFDGWTPSFILVETNVNDINIMFSKEFK